MSSKLDDLSSITDIAQLKSKRGYRKGILTKADHHLETIAGKSLSDVNVIELEARLQQTDESIAIFIAIQKWIDLLEEPDVLEREAESVESHLRTMESIHLNLATKLKACQVTVKLDTLHSELEDLLEVDELHSSSSQEHLRLLREQYTSLRSEASLYKSEPSINALLQKVREMIREVNSTVSKATRTLTPTPGSGTTATVSFTPSMSVSKLKVPTFSGKTTDGSRFGPSSLLSLTTISASPQPRKPVIS